MYIHLSMNLLIYLAFILYISNFITIDNYFVLFFFLTIIVLNSYKYVTHSVHCNQLKRVLCSLL